MSSYRDGIRAILQAHLTRGRELGKLVRAMPTGYAREHALQAYLSHRAAGETLIRKHLVDVLPNVASQSEDVKRLLTKYAHDTLIMRHAPNSAQGLRTDPFGPAKVATEFASAENGTTVEIDGALLKSVDVAVDSILSKPVDVF